MKKLLLLLGIILLSFNSFSQVREIERNEYDEFIKKTVIETNYQVYYGIAKLTGSYGAYTKIKVVDDGNSVNHLLYVKYHNQTNKTVCFNDDSKVYIKFENDSIIELNNQNEIECGERIYFIDNINDYLDLFRNEKVSKIRIQFSEGYMDFEGNYDGRKFNSKETFIEAFQLIDDIF